MRISLFLLRKSERIIDFMENGKIKIALGAPKIRLADVENNLNECVRVTSEASLGGADVLVFPELVLTGATCGDLFLNEALLDAATDALMRYVDMTRETDVLSFITLPLARGGIIYNAAVAVSGGEILGVSASGEVGSRHFAPAPIDGGTVRIGEGSYPLGSALTYGCDGARISPIVSGGEDAYVPSDANIIIRIKSEAEYIGLDKKRRDSLKRESLVLGAAVLLVGGGEGESGTDGVFAAPRILADRGEIVASAPLFSSELFTALLDTDERTRSGELPPIPEKKPTRAPFIPEDGEERREACELALTIQSKGLAARIRRSYSKCAVIGVSGGLDSTLALLVAARAMDELGFSRDKIIAITMPCFGTTERTKSNALALAEALGATVRTIDIKAAVNQHFSDISHDRDSYNVVYENAQARERTQILMDVANAVGGLVIGTGDLSELALGFATYNGDHMSMYGVNASVPKTLMREIIRYAAEKYAERGECETSRVLVDVVETPVSPELLPTDGGECMQHTEKIVGPYELHDFFIYYTVKYGMSPKRLFALAADVFSGVYTNEEIRTYLNTFISRFFSQQFKRSCLPDGPRVTEISLSPRGAWQMPSDVSSALWKNF